ncbi:hypothetical protein J6P92_03630 [bacterium]|nr:hypothetical protein [bacterium]
MDEELNGQNEQNIEISEEDDIVVEEEPVPDGKFFVKKKRRERKIRKGRLKQERLRAFFRFVICIVIIIGLYYLIKADGWYLKPNAFNKTDGNTVEIINNNIVPSKKILLILKESNVPNVPIFMARTNSIKKEILKLAPVEDVYIRRYAFPARMQIILRERTPVITIAPDIKANPVAFFTTDGKLIGREFLPLKPDYKTILVLTYGNKGDDYRKWDLKKIKEIQKIVRYVEAYSKEDVEYIDMRNPQDIYVKIKTVNIRAGKIDENIFKRLERIPSILPEVKEVKTKIKYLDLSWEKVNYLKFE